MAVKIWLYCLFGEENTIMPYFMRWYAPVCDRMVMLDGGSNDFTRGVIEQYANAVIEQSPFSQTHWDDHEGNAFYMEKYKEARGQADWVIMVDSDEFLYPSRKWASTHPLRVEIEDYTRKGIRAAQAIGAQMIAFEPPTGDGQIMDYVKMGVYDRVYNKTLLFDPDLWVRWSIGRHSCAISNYQQRITGLKLLHYRYFGEDYIRARNKFNWNRRSQVDKDQGIGYHTAPDYTGGKYSPDWYERSYKLAIDMIGGE